MAEWGGFPGQLLREPGRFGTGAWVDASEGRQCDEWGSRMGRENGLIYRAFPSPASGGAADSDAARARRVSRHGDRHGRPKAVAREARL